MFCRHITSLYFRIHFRRWKPGILDWIVQRAKNYYWFTAMVWSGFLWHAGWLLLHCYYTCSCLLYLCTLLIVYYILLCRSTQNNFPNGFYKPAYIGASPFPFRMAVKRTNLLLFVLSVTCIEFAPTFDLILLFLELCASRNNSILNGICITVWNYMGFVLLLCCIMHIVCIKWWEKTVVYSYTGFSFGLEYRQESLSTKNI